MYSIAQLLENHPPANERFHTIAIDGRGGSGKSALTEYLKALLPEFVFVNGDGYFEPLANNVAWGAFNDRRFNEDVLAPLRVGTSFHYRPYDWHSEPHITEHAVTVGAGLCLDRCFSAGLDFPWDISIWVETPREVCLEREVIRDADVGEARVREVWETIWQPAEDRYIEAVRPMQMATLVVDGTRAFGEQLER